MKSQFPHNTRIIAADLFQPLERLVFFSFFGALFVINSVAKTQSHLALDHQISLVLTHPYSPASHALLAKLYWQQGQLEAGRRELGFIQMLPETGEKTVLGATSQIHTWEEEPIRIAHAYSFWLQEIKKKPNYLDAYINLAGLSYQMQDLPGTVSYMKQAQKIDPNNQIMASLEKLLEKPGD